LGCLGLLIASYAIAIFLTGPYAWDDGAITVAFGRTFVQSGEFALTLASERVEGSSSLLFALLTGIPFVLSDFRMPTSVYIAQYLSLGSLITLLLAVNRYLKLQIVQRRNRHVLLLLLAVLPMFLAEMLNGMEMIVLATLFTTFCWGYRARSSWLYLVILCLLLCRFESIFYLGVALLMSFLLSAETRKFDLRLGLVTLGLFLAVTAVRYLYFGDILPNTIWAKLNPPYSDDAGLFASVKNHFAGAGDFLQVNSALILLGVAAAMLGSRWKILRDVKFWLVVAYLLFALITGPNLGFKGRMFIGILPVLLFLITDLAAERTQYPQRIIVGFAALALIATSAINAGQTRENLWQVASGVHHQGFASSHISAELGARIESNSLYATPERYRQTGEAVDRIREYLGLKTIRFSSPDVGGLALCCALESIEIVDSALLTNATLAHEGYGAFAGQLLSAPADVISIHAMWAEAAQIYQLEFFQLNYDPIIFNNRLLWLHRSHINTLMANPLVTLNPLSTEFDPRGLRQDLRLLDLAYLEAFKGSGRPIRQLL
jgi:hypothetical protein